MPYFDECLGWGIVSSQNLQMNVSLFIVTKLLTFTTFIFSCILMSLKIIKKFLIMYFFLFQTNHERIRRPFKSGPLPSMQYQASEYSRTQHTKALNALLAHHSRIRQSGNSGRIDSCSEFHERVSQVPRKTAQRLPEFRSTNRH